MVRFRPSLRFSLRTLLVLVSILCLGMGFALSWMRQRSEARLWISMAIRAALDRELAKPTSKVRGGFGKKRQDD